MLLDLTKRNLGVDIALDVARTDPAAHAALIDRDGRVGARRFAADPVAPSAFAGLDQRSECDCCGRMGLLELVDVTGIETYACEECRGVEPEETDPGPLFDEPDAQGRAGLGFARAYR